MPTRFEHVIDNWKGEDRRLDPAQLSEASPYMLNFDVHNKGTSIRTRRGWEQVAAADMHEDASGNESPALLAIYMVDKGYQGVVLAVVAGKNRSTVIKLHQHVFDDGTEIGSSSSREIQLFPPASDTSGVYWPRGAEAGGNYREQIDWFAEILSIFGRFVTWQQHQVPIVIGSDQTGKLWGIDRPLFVPSVSTSAPVPLHTGTAQGGAAGYITLAAGASGSNDTYNTGIVTINGGTGSGQKRTVSDYDGTTKQATPDTNFSTAPDATSTYLIADKSDIISGTAEGGSASSLVLPAQADVGTVAGTDDYYNGYTVVLIGGTGSGQSRTVSDYNGRARTITPDSDWNTDPDGTSEFILYPASASSGLTGDYEYKVTYMDRDLRFPSESAGSLASLTVSPDSVSSAQKVKIAAQTINYEHPASNITHVGIYRKRTSATETWSDFYFVKAVEVAEFEANGFDDVYPDADVLTIGEVLNEFKTTFRGMGIAAYHGNRVYAGSQADWTGTADVELGRDYAILSPSAGNAAHSNYAHFIGERRFIDIAGVQYPILRAYKDDSDQNIVEFANDDRSGTKGYSGATAASATTKLIGDKRTIFASYAGNDQVAYADARYEIRPGVDSDGDLMGLAPIRSDLLACYQRAIYVIGGGNFADRLNNRDPAINWYDRIVNNNVGLVAPKTLVTDKGGRVYGYGGPNNGVWMCDGLSLYSISDDTLRERLQGFGDHKFCTAVIDPMTEQYRLFFPHSDDEHFFAFNYETKTWTEGNHIGATAALNSPPVVGGTAPGEAATEDESIVTLGFQFENGGDTLIFEVNGTEYQIDTSLGEGYGTTQVTVDVSSGESCTIEYTEGGLGLQHWGYCNTSDLDDEDVFDSSNEDVRTEDVNELLNITPTTDMTFSAEVLLR